jgi:hypothetical protein
MNALTSAYLITMSSPVVFGVAPDLKELAKEIEGLFGDPKHVGIRFCPEW